MQPKTTPTVNANQNVNQRSAILWLIGSILFFLFSGLAVQYFLPDNITNNSEGNTVKYILGIFGVLTYFIEPVILAFYTPDDIDTDSEEDQRLWVKIANVVMTLIVSIPIWLFSFFRPVFRALLLFISFSYLNGPGPDSRVFVILVTADILLYYFHKWLAIDWLSPATLVIKLFKIRERPWLANMGDIFFVFYTAFVYSFFLKMGYGSDERRIDPENEKWLGLLVCWFFATLYTRLPFIGDEENIAGRILQMPRKLIIINLLILVISLAAYLWPYFSGRG